MARVLPITPTAVPTLHPDIIRSGLPVFFFDEVELLKGKTMAELEAIARVKTTFPTSRLLQ